MKYYLHLLALAVLLLSFQPTPAQNTAPYWSLTGNSNATTSARLGTTNNVALKFYTSNVQRMVISRSTGNVGIGTNNPSGGRLHINSPSGIHPFRAQVNGQTKLLVHSGGGVSVGANVVPPANGLNVAGRSSFNNQLTVAKGGLRVHLGDEADTGLVVQGSGFDDKQVGIVTHGYGAGLIAGGFYHGIRAGGTVGISVTSIETGMELTGFGDGINLKVAGNSGVVSSAEQIGVYGTAAGAGVIGYTEGFPSAGVEGGSKYGYGGWFTSVEDYGLVAQTTNGDYAGVFYGNVLTSGMYVSSDENLKQQVQVFEGAMHLINKLKPRNYQYKRDGQYAMLNLPMGQHYGLLAQEVEKVLPNLVSTSSHHPLHPIPQPDSEGRLRMNKNALTQKPEAIRIKAVNYTELIPIMIKGMQEQQERIESLEEKAAQVEELKARLQKLETLLSNRTAIPHTITSAYLEQNTPNPVNGITVIRYHIPETTNAAKLTISNAKGQVVKAITISNNGTGEVKLNTAMLSSGTYSYTLYVNGRQVDTKQLVVTN